MFTGILLYSKSVTSYCSVGDTIDALPAGMYLIRYDYSNKESETIK